MNKKTKIVHISRFAKPYVGGIETVIEQINDSLPDEKFEKEVFCCSNTDISSEENGVKYNRCRYLFDFAANSISPQLFFKIMGLKTDIIHFHMPVLQNVIFWFILYHLKLLKYKKMIITYHGAIVGYDKYMKPFWGLYKYFYKKADRIHVLSPTIIDSDDVLYNNRDRCRVIPFGIDINRNESINNILINGNDINAIAKGRKKLLCMGRIVSWKGFHIAIEAMNYIENAILFIAGDGPCLNEYKTIIENNNLSDKVVLLGKVIKEEEKDFLFSSVDIFILPTIRKSESFGIVQLEAMKYGKPVINTKLGTGVNYVSIDNETGLTVEPGNVKQLVNAINELLNNDNLRIQYGENARKRVDDLFDINNIKPKYKHLYEELYYITYNCSDKENYISKEHDTL